MSAGEPSNRTGAVLADRYRIGERVAELEEVALYRARDEAIGRPLALLFVERALAPASLRAMAAELAAAGRINHPGVVAMRDVVGLPEGIACAVFDELAGRPLRAMIAEVAAGRTVPWPIVRSIMVQLLDAVVAVRARGGGFEALGPDLIYLDELDGGVTARLLPTGFAALREAAPMAMIDAGYVSPELVQQRPTDARSEIYQLGCVLFALATGRAPFVGDSKLECMAQHLIAPRPSLTPSDAAPAGLGAVIARMLAIEPAQRYQTIDEAREAVRALEVPAPAATQLHPLDGGAAQVFHSDVVRFTGAPDGRDVAVPELGADAYVDLIRQPRGGWLVHRLGGAAVPAATLASGEVLDVAGRRWRVEAVQIAAFKPVEIELTVTYGPPPDWNIDGPSARPGSPVRWLALIALALLAIASGWWWLAR